LIQICVKYTLSKKKKIYFLVTPFNIQWSLCYNFIHVYFIKFSNGKVGLNITFTSQFQTYLFPTLIISKILKFCSWFTINLIKCSIVSRWNLNKIWIYFLVFLLKMPFFKLNISCQFFLYFYHAFTQMLTLMHMVQVLYDKL